MEGESGRPSQKATERNKIQIAKRIVNSSTTDVSGNASITIKEVDVQRGPEQILLSINVSNCTISLLKAMMFVTVIMAKMVFVQTNKMADLIKLMQEEDAQTVESKDRTIKKNYNQLVKYCHRMVVIIVFCIYLTAGIYICDGLYHSYNFYITHPYINATTEKPHPVPFWFPFDKNRHYYVAMAYQIIHIAQTCIYNGSVQATIISVTVFLKAELRILQHSIRNLRPYKGKNMFAANMEDTTHTTIKNCIKEHQKIIRWVTEFNGYFQYIMLLEYVVTSFILAAILIDILQGVKTSFNMALFAFITLQLFTLAWTANEIIIESSLGLSEALYECEWYNLDEQSKILIKIMMIRCRKPLALSIGPFGSMTVDSAVSRMKLAYSVLSVLSTN